MYSISKHVNTSDIRLDLNEYDFNHPEDFYTTLKTNIENKLNITHYTNTCDVNTTNLMNEISIYNNWKKENILLTAGSDNALEYIVNTFVNENTKVIIPYPSYDYFSVLLRHKENIVWVPNTFQEEYDICQLLVHHNIENVENTLIYIVNPNNPIGNKLNHLQQALETYDQCLFIIDEAYINFTHPVNSSSFLLGEYPNLLITRSFSKAFGLAGIRLGYILANELIIKKIALIYNQKSVTEIAKISGLYVMQNIEYYNEIIKEIIKIRTEFEEFLTEHKIFFFKSYANFVSIFVGKNIEIVTNTLKTRGFIVRNKDSMKEFIRITIGNSTNMNRLKTVLTELFCFFDKSYDITR